MATVKDTHGLCCPKCGSDDRIKVSITTWAVLLPEGSEQEGDHEWSYKSPAFCTECEFSGTACDFDVEEQAKKGGDQSHG